MQSSIAHFSYHDAKMLCRSRKQWPNMEEVVVRETRAYPLLRNFSLQKLIGIGSFGSVYEADTSILKQNQPVAVKISTNFDKVDDILFQVTLLSNIRHPNIIKLYCAFFDEVPVMILELGQGSLRQLNTRKTSEYHKVNLLMQVLQGAHFIHERQVAHLNLTPDNILLVNGVAKISGFGSAENLKGCISEPTDLKPLDRMKTSFLYSNYDGFKKNANYMSDMYCVGATFFELVTGKNLIKTIKYARLAIEDMEGFYRKAHEDGRLIERDRVEEDDILVLVYGLRQPLKDGLKILNDYWAPVICALMRYDDNSDITSIKQLLDHGIIKDLKYYGYRKEGGPLQMYQLNDCTNNKVPDTISPRLPRLSANDKRRLVYDSFFICSHSVKSRKRYFRDFRRNKRNSSRATEQQSYSNSASGSKIRVDVKDYTCNKACEKVYAQNSSLLRHLQSKHNKTQSGSPTA